LEFNNPVPREKRKSPAADVPSSPARGTPARTAPVATNAAFAAPLAWLAHLYVFCKGGNSCRWRRDFDLGLAPLIDSHRARFPESITPITAPWPLLRLQHQAPRYRIAVHIAQLLNPLACRPYVEIVEASLPHVLAANRKQFLLGGPSALAHRLQDARSLV